MDILLLSYLPFASPMWCRLEWALDRPARCRNWVRYGGPSLALPWLAGICFSLGRSMALQLGGDGQEFFAVAIPAF